MPLPPMASLAAFAFWRYATPIEMVVAPTPGPLPARAGPDPPAAVAEPADPATDPDDDEPAPLAAVDPTPLLPLVGMVGWAPVPVAGALRPATSDVRTPGAEEAATVEPPAVAPKATTAPAAQDRAADRACMPYLPWPRVPTGTLASVCCANRHIARVTRRRDTTGDHLGRSMARSTVPRGFWHGTAPQSVRRERDPGDHRQRVRRLRRARASRGARTAVFPNDRHNQHRVSGVDYS